ncbi:MAG: hypothetical protein U1E65_14825 [Myxococcota bacterium]
MGTERRQAWGWAAAACLWAIAMPAHADEGEWVLALEPDFGAFSDVDGTRIGFGGQASLWLGLTTATWLFVDGGAHRALDGGPTIGETVGGVVVALDVLRTIPFAELGLGADVLPGRVEPVLRLGIGADFLVTPRFSVGVVGRYRPVFGAGGESWYTLSLRIGLRGGG